MKKIIETKIDQFFEQERELCQVEDFVRSIRRQICFFVPEQINLLNGSVDHLKQVVNRLDQFLELTDYLNERFFEFYQKNQGTA
jgi:hypothetical protein